MIGVTKVLAAYSLNVSHNINISLASDLFSSLDKATLATNTTPFL